MGPVPPFGRDAASALLPEYIHDEHEPLRALFVLAGNPLLTVGGGDRLSVLRSLELLVSIDLYRNATGELADFVLPATDEFEREDLNVFVQGVQGGPLQWTPGSSRRGGEARQEWQIYGQLLQAMGRTPMLDPGIADPCRCCSTARSQPAVPASVRSVTRRGPAAAGARPRRLARPVGHRRHDRRRARRPPFDARPRPRAVRGARQGIPDQFKLVTRKTRTTINSWLQNLPSPADDDDDAEPALDEPRRRCAGSAWPRATWWR